MRLTCSLRRYRAGVAASDVGIAREVDADTVGQERRAQLRPILVGKFGLLGRQEKTVLLTLRPDSAADDSAFATSYQSDAGSVYTTEDMFRLLMKDFEAKGATVGRTPVFPDCSSPRRALFGMTSSIYG